MLSTKREILYRIVCILLGIRVIKIYIITETLDTRTVHAGVRHKRHKIVAQILGEDASVPGLFIYFYLRAF